MDEGERRARNIFLARGAEAGHKAFGECGFAAPEFAFEQDQAGRVEALDERSAKPDRLLGRGADSLEEKVRPRP